MDVRASTRHTGRTGTDSSSISSTRWRLGQSPPHARRARRCRHASRQVRGGTVTAGIEGGQDWIRSTNLGDHELSRGSGFGEWRLPLGGRAQVDAALRVDRYSEFGTSWSPSVGVGWSPARALRLRASAGRAFRVPTFTERYYSDPANIARAEVGPERSWSGDGGADLFLASGWVVQATYLRSRRQRRHRLAPADGSRPVADLQHPRHRYEGRRAGCTQEFFDRGVPPGAIHRARPRCSGSESIVQVRARLRAPVVRRRRLAAAPRSIPRFATRRVPPPEPVAEPGGLRVDRCPRQPSIRCALRTHGGRHEPPRRRPITRSPASQCRERP